MPVDDIPVHDKVRQKAGAKYGCFDRKSWGIGYQAPDRQYRNDGTYVEVHTFISHKMSTKCRYDMAKTDKLCEGCDAKKDTEYLDRMLAL